MDGIFSQPEKNADPIAPTDKFELAEVVFHKRFNLVLAVVFTPVWLGLAGFYQHFGYPWQALIFLLLFCNALAGIGLTFALKTDRAQISLNRITVSITFGLLAAALINGMLNIHLPTFLPWI